MRRDDPGSSSAPAYSFLNTNDKRAAAQAFIDGMKQVHYGDLSWEPSRRREELNKPGMRQVLESGILDALFIAAKDVGDGSNGPLAELILGAMMMRAGVEIPDAHMARLRELVPHLGCGAYMRDDGTFANPGQAQYLAALDLYKAGTPRSFAEASCDYCGKTEADVGHKLIENEDPDWSCWCTEECHAAKGNSATAHRA